MFYKLNIMNLGEKIRKLRIQKHMTLRDVSDKCGCSLGFLSQVERDLVSPTISSLKKIAEALDTNIMAFFNESDSHEIENSVVVRKKDRGRFVNERSRVTYELLRPQFSDTTLEALYMYLKPNASSGDTPHTHKGEEFFLVLKGKFKIEVGDKTYILEEGDAGMYKSSVPHRWCNPSDKEEAIVIWVNHPPTF